MGQVESIYLSIYPSTYLDKGYDKAYASLMRDFRRNCLAASEIWTMDALREVLTTHHIVLEPEVLESLVRGLVFSRFPSVQQAYSELTTLGDGMTFNELMALPARYRLIHLLTKLQAIAGVPHDGNGGFPTGRMQLFFTPFQLAYALFRCANKVVIKRGKMYAICGHEYCIADYTALRSPIQRAFVPMYHGTFRSNLVGIKEKGLLPMTKDCIYFSSVWPSRGLVPGKGDSPFNAVVIVRQAPLVAQEGVTSTQVLHVSSWSRRSQILVEALAVQAQNFNTGLWEAWEGMPTEAP